MSAATEDLSADPVRAPALPPKPRSMQSRFILMEGGTVALALLLMAAALAVSFLMQRQFSYEAGTLQQEMALSSRIHTAFDGTVLGFWRYFGTRSAVRLEEYQHSAAEFARLTGEVAKFVRSPQDQQEAARLASQEAAFLQDLNHAAGECAANIEPSDSELGDLSTRELEIRKTFAARENDEFTKLADGTAKLGVYTALMRVLLLVFGLFPVLVMLWFRRAHGRHIWGPLERLRGMVLEVRRGNLNITGEAPATVELGSVTKAFLAMSSELREMRDSLEDKVKQRAVQLETAHQELLRAAKLASLGQLVSGVAHEINNPLTSILGFSEVVLGRPEIEPPVRAHVQTIRNEAIRLKHVVANLSRFSRRAPQHATRLDLRTIPDRMIELRSYQLAANNISVCYQRAEEPVWVKGEPEALLQMLMQLTLNAEQAIRQCRASGEIVLECGEWQGRARLAVKDNGAGMSAEMRERIFDPFFTTRTAGEGAGLGLSISHGIIQQHGGNVEIESETGKGTTISVLLPSAGAEEPSRPVAPAATPPRFTLARNPFLARAPEPERRDRGTRYLVIDDEAEILHLISAVLEKDGAEVFSLQDSSRVEAMLAERRYDAVLCDLKMPGRDGLAVLRILREAWPDLAQRFLLLTGNLADADKAGAELQGVPILPKPFTLARLRQAIEQMTAARSDSADRADRLSL